MITTKPSMLRVLTPPDGIVYVYGFLVRSTIPELRSLPLIWYGTIVAILDERSYIERTDTLQPLWVPRDHRWLIRHPGWNVNPPQWKEAS
jgi:hypothetical protein